MRLFQNGTIQNRKLMQNKSKTDPKWNYSKMELFKMKADAKQIQNGPKTELLNILHFILQE